MEMEKWLFNCQNQEVKLLNLKTAEILTVKQYPTHKNGKNGWKSKRTR